MSDTDRTTDIKLQISSVFDGTGTSTAQQELGKTADAASRISSAADPDAVKKSLEEMNGELRAAKLMLKEFQEGWEGITNTVKKWQNALGKTMGSLAVMAVGIRVIKGVYDFFTADSRAKQAKLTEEVNKTTEAAKKMKEKLAETRESTAELANMKNSQEALNSMMRAYQSQTAELQSQLEIERKKAAIQAKMQGFSAQAEKFELDNKLERGEIGINEYREQSRVLEDKALKQRYAAEVADANKEIANLRDQSRLTGEALKLLQGKATELGNGDKVVLTPLQIDELDANKTSNTAKAAELDNTVAKLESIHLGNTKATQDLRDEAARLRAENTQIDARKKASSDWLKQDGHGGNYENWKALKQLTGEQMQEKTTSLNEGIKKIQELQKTVEGLGEAQIAEQDMVERNRKNEDATNETKDFRIIPVKQAVEQLTKEKTDLAEAAKLLEQSAKSDAAALADASAGVADAAKAAKGFGDVGLGKEVQDFMGGFEKMLKSSGELAGKGDKLATMSTTLQDLIKKGVFSPQQSNDLQEAMRVLISMAETQTAQKSNTDKTAELDKKIADLNSIETARRNIAEDSAAYERMADSLTRQAEEQAAKNEGDAAAQAALQTAIKTLADKTVTPDELPALLEAQESLNGATDAASVKTRELLNLIITGLGTAAGRLNKQSADLEANKTEVNRINASLAYPNK